MRSGKVSSILRDGAVAVPNEDTNQKLNRAKGYPYPRPPRSFLYVDEATFEFESSNWTGLTSLSSLSVYDTTENAWRTVSELGFPNTSSFDSFTPVLAIGSNASPEQLRRKFPRSVFPDGVVIPVVECVLEDFDVVYCPLLCSYGSCPATLEYCPGTAVSVYITYLDDAAYEHMNATEGAYDLLELSNIKLHVGLPLAKFGTGQRPPELRDTIFQYNYQLGTLHLPLAGHGQGSPVALAEIRALNRQFPSLTQPQVLQAIRYLFYGDPAKSVHLSARKNDTNVALVATRQPKKLLSVSASKDSGGQSSGGSQLALVSSSEIVAAEAAMADGTTATEAVGVFEDGSETSFAAVKVLHLPGQGDSANGDSAYVDDLSSWATRAGLEEWIHMAVSGANARNIRRQVTLEMEKYALSFRYKNARVVQSM